MQKVTSKDGTQIAYDKRGQGPALILVGGAFQHRAIDQNTAQLAGLLAKDFTTYHYDRRGRGDSGDTQPYSVEREIEDLDALIQEAGGSAYVFGMSSGGVLGLHAAARGLNNIKKLALYEPPFMLGEEREQYRKQLSTFLEESRLSDAVELSMVSWGAPAEVVAGMKQSPVWAMFEAVAPTLAYDSAIMGDSSVPITLLGSITIPTLVMAGGSSPETLRHAAEKAAQTLKTAQHRILEGQTHDVKPEVLAPILAGFFKD